MLWRYAQNHATAADSIKDIKAAQLPRLLGPMSLLDRELRDKRFLFSEEISGANHFLFMSGALARKRTAADFLVRKLATFYA